MFRWGQGLFKIPVPPKYLVPGGQVKQVIAAVIAERQQMRKVRASQGRVPDNVRWRRLQGQCNRNVPLMLHRSISKGGRAV